MAATNAGPEQRGAARAPARGADRARAQRVTCTGTSRPCTRRASGSRTAWSWPSTGPTAVRGRRARRDQGPAGYPLEAGRCARAAPWRRCTALDPAPRRRAATASRVPQPSTCASPVRGIGRRAGRASAGRAGRRCGRAAGRRPRAPRPPRRAPRAGRADEADRKVSRRRCRRTTCRVVAGAVPRERPRGPRALDEPGSRAWLSVADAVGGGEGRWRATEEVVCPFDYADRTKCSARVSVGRWAGARRPGRARPSASARRDGVG